MKKFLLILIVMFAITGYNRAQTNSGHQSNPPDPIMVQSAIHPPNAPAAPGCRFLVLMDNLPWGGLTSVTDILTAKGAFYDVANSSTFPGMNFSNYDVIIIESDQVISFHTAFQANFPKFVNFVTSGGSLEVHAATCGWNSPCGYSVILPGGVFTTEQYDNYDVVVDPSNAIVAGVPSPFWGSYASHGYFSNLQPATDIITATQSNGLPTTIQYHYGAGLVTGTTCTYEYGYMNGQAAGIMLQNNLNYSCSHAQAAGVPTLSQWGLIIMGFLFLSIGTIVILRWRGASA